MNVEILNQFMLSLFFIYLLLISTNINMLLNCSIHRFLQKNMYIKHIILFVSIYLLTFILNWYTPEAIVVNKEGFTNNYDLKKYSYLFESFFYSVIIYLTFLMTSKMEVSSFIVFISLLILAFIIYLLYKVNLSKIGLQKIQHNSFFITQKSIIDNIKPTQPTQPTETTETLQPTKLLDINQSEINNIVLLYNMLSIVYTSLPFVIGYGVYNYWKKQKKDHRKKFNTLTFFIGVEKCR